MAFPVAVVQAELEPGAAEGNRQTATRLVAQAAAGGAQLIVLPEACISDIYRGAQEHAEAIPGPSTDTIARVCGEAVVAVPLLEKKNGDVFSACAFVSSRGIRGVARKTHRFRDPTGHDSFKDDEVVSAGQELGIAEINGLRAGVLIGFDAEFPEAFRALALRGADVLVVVLNCVEPDHRFLCSMALRNRIPLLVANRLGFKRVYPAVPEYSASVLSLVQDKEGTFLVRCKGGSAIIDENGRVIAESSQQQQRDLETLAGAPPGLLIPRAHFQDEQILTASFRLEELRVQRLTSPYISERREELYRVK